MYMYYEMDEKKFVTRYFYQILFVLFTGCAINHPDAEGTTPLTKAIQNGNSAVVDRLLSHPDINVNLGTKAIPLHTAVHKTDERVIRKLIQLGADINRVGIHLLNLDLTIFLLCM